MSQEIARVAADASQEQILAGLDECGAVIVEDVLDSDTLKQFNAEIDPHLAAVAPGRELVNPLIAGFMGAQTRHITGVAAKSPIFVDEVLCHPLLLAIADEILLPSCSRYQLNIAHVLERGPGSPQQMLHRDELVWCQVPRPHGELQLASIIALVDFTADNGATRLVPGSHRWPLEREAQPGELAVAEMSAGSAVIYLGSTIHGGGSNTTEHELRRGMHHSYTLGWLRTEENHYLSIPMDVARGFSDQALELLGYASHDALLTGGGYLGAVDTRDPIQLIRAGDL